ncbi:hypothetical protein C8R46DRAFT_1221901 [Mycena filopes]|nr:hypothetical protein C8R46DRAFT_1221901 [Mycena filopes]
MPAFTFQSENEKFTPTHTNGEVPASSDHGNTKYRKNFRWGEYVPAAPAAQKPALNARSAAAEVSISHLKISPEQRKLIDAMYHPAAGDSFEVPPIVDHIFTQDINAQVQASAIMAQYGLDVDSREHIGSRWSQQWSRSDKTNNNTRKILYLCSCGYDHRQRNTKYDHGENPTGVPGTQQRHTGAPFTACLAHAEITVRADNILRVRGHFNHNEACKTALFENIPPIPVHPSVYTVALAQLRDGAAFSDIRRKNRELFQAKAYKDFPRDISSSQFRWLLTHNDSRSLYRQYNRMKGVTVTDAPQVNVDEWLDPKSNKYNPTLAHAIFHYAARASKDERFEVAIATDDMNRAAWRSLFLP